MRNNVWRNVTYGLHGCNKGLSDKSTNNAHLADTDNYRTIIICD